MALNSRNWRRPGESFLPRAFFFPVVPDVSVAPDVPELPEFRGLFFGAGLSVLALALAGELVVELLVADILARF